MTNSDAFLTFQQSLRNLEPFLRSGLISSEEFSFNILMSISSCEDDMLSKIAEELTPLSSTAISIAIVNMEESFCKRISIAVNSPGTSESELELDSERVSNRLRMLLDLLKNSGEQLYSKIF